MEHDDLEKYLTAKRQHKLAQVTAAIAAILFIVAAALWFSGTWDFLVVGVLIGSVLGSQVAMSDIATSRKTLLGIVESQINRDPAAIAYLSSRSS